MRALSALTCLLGLCLAPAYARTRHTLVETDLVSDQAGVAAQQDPTLQNAWGMAFDVGRGAIWVAANHSGVVTAYRPDGTPLGLTVTVPAAAPGGTGSPTGLVFNRGADFHADQLIVVTEDGLVAGWPSTSAGSADEAFVEVNDSASGAIFKGVALAQTSSGSRLFAADFHNGRVAVFDGSFQPVTASGGFTDPNATAGFAPFNVATIHGKLYVSYAKQDADAEDDDPGPGNGFIDVFDTDGHLLRRFASGSAAGGALTVLDSPWAMVESRTAKFGRAILVGNFGSGQIAVFQGKRAHGRTTLQVSSGPVTIDGLWALAFGAGGAAGDTKTVYFTAGPNHENDGLFGTLTAAVKKRQRRPPPARGY